MLRIELLSRSYTLLFSAISLSAETFKITNDKKIKYHTTILLKENRKLDKLLHSVFDILDIPNFESKQKQLKVFFRNLLKV